MGCGVHSKFFRLVDKDRLMGDPFSFHSGPVPLYLPGQARSALPDLDFRHLLRFLGLPQEFAPLRCQAIALVPAAWFLRDGHLDQPGL